MGMLKTSSLIGGVNFEEKCASKQKHPKRQGFKQHSENVGFFSCKNVFLS